MRETRRMSRVRGDGIGVCHSFGFGQTWKSSPKVRTGTTLYRNRIFAEMPVKEENLHGRNTTAMRQMMLREAHPRHVEAHIPRNKSEAGQFPSLAKLSLAHLTRPGCWKRSCQLSDGCCAMFNVFVSTTKWPNGPNVGFGHLVV